MRKALANTGLLAATFVVCFGLFELGLLALAGFGADSAAGTVYRYEDIYLSDKPLAVFDQVAGYRRTPGPTRFLRIVHDQLVYDHTFTPNNAGFISTRDYAREKPPGALRLAVLGDSFTSAEFNASNWPDQVNAALQGKSTKPIELISFAENGAGLANWHGLFFDDIAPHYTFDALVIAVYGDDLARGYSYLHYEGPTAYIGYFPTRAQSEEDFRANYLPKMSRHIAAVETPARIDEIVARLHQSWHWPGFALRSGPLIGAQWRRLREGRLRARPATAVQAPAPVTDLSLAAVEAAYGPAQFKLFTEIMDYCREHRIPVLLASVPSREDAKAAAESHGAQESPHSREVRFLAQSFGALYMDGANAFTGAAPEDIDKRYWLKFDGHWNQAGSELFAAAMTKFLLANQEKLAASP